MAMKKIVVISLILCCCATTVFPWGPTGHRATGWIAEKYLTKKARKQLERILKGQSLAMATTWMDDVRSDSTYKHMTDWHWVTIPTGQTYDQSTKNPNGDIIQTLERIIAELEQKDQKKLSDQQQMIYIMMIAHLIGDIHQPLHVGGKDDKGGNDVKLQWMRDDTNLHRVWDSDMIDETRLSYTELAQSLDKVDEMQIGKWQKSSVRDWAAESQSYEKQVYDYSGTRLGYTYSYRNFPTVRLRLLQAGVRLAGVLNKIYGK
jgi:hypothetical protein